MSETASKGWGIPWPAVFAVLVAGGGALLYFQPLTSSRPPGEPVLERRAYGWQDVPARLWQDPFKTTTEYRDAATRPARAHDLAEVQRQLLSTAGEKTLVLGVIVSAGPYAELGEQRLRTRVAILEGLARCGLEPESESRIGYVQMPWVGGLDFTKLSGSRSVQEQMDSPSTSQLLIPYEWCRRATIKMVNDPLVDKVPDRVLVLWIDEDALNDFPLTRLALVLKRIGQTIDAWPAGKRSANSSAEAPIEIKIIGPRASSTLRSMVEEARTPNVAYDAERAPPGPLDGVTMYSPTASAGDDILLATPPSDAKPKIEKDSPEPPISQLFRKTFGLTFIRTARTDRYLCNILVDELRLRLAATQPSVLAPYADVAEKTHIAPETYKALQEEMGHIAVITEWDSFYGKALPLSFASAITGAGQDAFLRQTREDAGGARPTWPQRLHMRYYLRGIDGKVPAAANQPQRPDGSKSATGEDLKLAAPGERPEGLDQSDYLRRLADNLDSLDNFIRDTAAPGRFPHDSRGIRAIGVLGTDLYDKLLVLRALRDRFPGALFFTIDLDARYSLPAEWRATHTLVIISPFDLSLYRMIQGGIPPFRDSGQTAIFSATLAALGGLPEVLPQGSLLPDLARLGVPRRLEVGRRGFYDLTVLQPPFETISRDNHTLQPDRNYRQPWRWLRPGRIGMFVSVVLFAAVALYLGVRPEILRKKDYGLYAVFLLLICLLVGLPLLAHLDGAEGQPISFIDGVSVWPTIILRGVAVVISGYLIVKLLVTDNNAQMQEWFGLKGLADANTRNAPDALHQESISPTFFYGDWKVYQVAGKDGPQTPVRPGQGCVKAQNLWWEYRRRAGWPVRFVRTLSLFIPLLACLALLYLGFDEPLAPVRGPVTQCIESTTFWLAGAVGFFLILLVLDDAYLNRRLIRYLTRIETDWPIDTQSAFDASGIQWNIGSKNLSEFFDIRFIAMHTAVVGRFIYYPFLVLFIMVLGRNSYFADWDWSPGLLIATSLCVGFMLVGTIMLRSAAEAARVQALRRIQARAMVLMADPATRPVADALNKIGDVIASERQGAFSVLSQYPLLAAILLPSGGIGIWVLIEYVARTVR